MKRAGWLRVAEREALEAIADLHLEYDEDPTDRVPEVRGAYMREDFFTLMDLRDEYTERLKERRAGL